MATATEPNPSSRTSPARQPWQIEWRLVAWVLGLKALVLGFAAISILTLTDDAVQWDAMWNRWDATHYRTLALNGYQAAGEERFSLVFFPLYPWLVRGAHFALRDYTTAAFFVSGLASVAAGLLLHRLATIDATSHTGRAAVWFLFIFPTSYFLHIGYTESLFLALVLGSLLAARRSRWALAGLLGACAALTRINGLLLMPVLAAEALLQLRGTRRIDWRWLWIGAVSLGFVGYLGLNAAVTGDPFAFSSLMSERWYKQLAPPWVGISDLWARRTFAHFTEWFLELAFVALAFICTVWCWFRLRVSYAVWMTLNWLLITSTSFIVSVPRYSLTLFPLFILVAGLAVKRPLVGSLISGASLLMLALLVSRFVRGLWAY
jgi:hypothetical protein